MNCTKRTLIKSLIAIAVCPASLFASISTRTEEVMRTLGPDEEILVGDIMFIPGIYCETLSRVWRGTTPSIIKGEHVIMFNEDGTKSSVSKALKDAVFLRKI